MQIIVVSVLLHAGGGFAALTGEKWMADKFSTEYNRIPILPPLTVCLHQITVRVRRERLT